MNGDMLLVTEFLANNRYNTANSWGSYVYRLNASGTTLVKDDDVFQSGDTILALPYPIDISDTEEYDATKYMRKDELKELCKRYDDLRRDFIYFWQKSSKDAKYYTKTGDMLLHELEFCNPTDKDIVKKARLVQSDRAIRRGMKVSSLIAFPIVCSFGLRNATGFLELAIDGAKKEKDLQAYLDNIKYNKEIYSRALKREEVEEENE
jgi:hypothetical protein